MSYMEILRKKNKVLAVTLAICIILRCVVNAFFVGIAQVIPMGIGGLIFTGILYFLSSKINPVVMSYMMVGLMSVISILLGGLCVPIVLALMALIVLSLIGLSHEEIYDMPVVYCLYSSMSILGYGLYVFIAIKWKNKRNKEYYGDKKIKQTQ
ncbi:MAG: hypothetical protein II765_00480, partial [Lachnospiraceae bacterium]|nr:hypothetical protein [Lachnospiraceae bacterium]